MCKLHYMTYTGCGHENEYKITYCKKHKDGLKGIGLGCMDRQTICDKTTMSKCQQCIYEGYTGKEVKPRVTLCVNQLEMAYEDDA